MLHAKQTSTRNRNRKTIALLGTAGLSLSLMSGISAASAAPAADASTRNNAVGHEITLCEEEISDVSLATYYVFDNENARTFRRGIKFGAGGCGCGQG
jgi:hypothetical protein